MLFLTLCLVTLAAQAGAKESAGYVVRYSVINSMQIPQQVAQKNAIKRRGDRAIITITLQHPTDSDPFNAVAARVTGHARTLLGKRYPLDFRRVRAANSVYSLATLPLEQRKQIITLDLEVRTADGSLLIPVEFNQTLYRQK